MAKITEVLQEAKKLGFKKVESADITWTIDRFQEITDFFEGEYQLFNDPKGGRIDWVDHENGPITTCYLLWR